jgi:hypothetical protein
MYTRVLMCRVLLKCLDFVVELSVFESRVFLSGHVTLLKEKTM